MRKWLIAAALVAGGVLLGDSAVWALGGSVGGPGGSSGGRSSGGNRGKFKPGTDKTYSWKRMDLNAARKCEKPILLYVYDPMIKKRNNTAQFFELDLFPKDPVVEVLKDFTFVMLPATAAGWPLPYTTFAKGGATLAVMTCDGAQPLAFWHRDSRPTVQSFVFAIRAALASNPQALEKMKKNPPPKFVEAPKAGAAGPVAQAEPEEKKPEKPGLVPGLDGDDEKNKKKKKPKKPKRPGAKDEDEDE